MFSQKRKNGLLSLNKIFACKNAEEKIGNISNLKINIQRILRAFKHQNWSSIVPIMIAQRLTFCHF